MQNIPINIEDEMKRSYLDYAMSVIIGRALPDLRDGLKPVQRRILYAMHELGNSWQSHYKKSARIVGDVIGKYHPHGDQAVYEALVRTAQDFSLRYQLVDGQGNFGSIDGDPPAAMRYTEVRMTKLASELLADLDKETVDFAPNYDGTLFEPSVLPSKIPHLLINGASGIAVGMATNIPPHNLSEVIEAIINLIKDPDMDIEGLMELIPGPDFPTGGLIYGQEGIRMAYQTGKGMLRIRAKTSIEKREKREYIIISEIPYQVNKAKLVENIAELMREKKIEGIQEIRDESDRQGLRIVIELKREGIAPVILNQLYQHTQLQVSFGITFLAILSGQPQILNLKEILSHLINYRKEVILRRTAFELKKAEEKAHLLEGLKVAIENLTEVISLIKSSPDPLTAKEALSKRFSFSEAQAKAILDMRLQRLTTLEREKVLKDHRDTLNSIKDLREILSSEERVLDIIVKELREIKEKYGDERRTKIIPHQVQLSLEDTILEEDMVVTITHDGYIKRNPISLYRGQHRGGKGALSVITKEDDFVEHLFITTTLSYILFFTERGQVFWLKVYEIPEGGKNAKGKAIVNLLNLLSGERIAAVLSVKDFKEGGGVVMATQKGVVKKTELKAYSRPRSSGIIAIHLLPGDRLIGAKLVRANDEVFLGTREGKAIRFSQAEVRGVGRTSQGVRGIRLAPNDQAVVLGIISNEAFILSVTENGFGKKTLLSNYPKQKRGGKGVITIKIDGRRGKVVGMVQVSNKDDLMLITNKGKLIRMPSKGIPKKGRSSKGVKLMDLSGEEKVVAIAPLVEGEKGKG